LIADRLFTAGGKPVTVLWYDDGRAYLPREAEPLAQVDLPFPAAQARLTRTITVPELFYRRARRERRDFYF